MQESAEEWQRQKGASATYLATRFNPKYVMERLGHSKVETTMRYYIHILSELQAQAALAIDELFGDKKVTASGSNTEKVVLLKASI